LVETLLVIGLFTFVFALGLFMTMETYRGYSRRSDRDTFVGVLERARSRAMANVNQHTWGVCYETTNPADPKYVIFSGASYASAFTTEFVPANPGVTFDLTSAPTLPCVSGGIVFAQLTGNSSSASATLTEGGITSTVAVNAMGRVDW
jgi:hypothetical protein